MDVTRALFEARRAKRLLDGERATVLVRLGPWASDATALFPDLRIELN